MMARKNQNVRRSNDKGRMARRQRGELRLKTAKQPPVHVDIEKMILPDGQCRFMNPRRPKARFATKDRADRALVQAQRKRAHTGTGHVEKRVYRCPAGGCEGWHLTSRESFDENIRKSRLELAEKKRTQEGTS